jgi:hypothetical protein
MRTSVKPARWVNERSTLVVLGFVLLGHIGIYPMTLGTSIELHATDVVW